MQNFKLFIPLRLSRQVFKRFQENSASFFVSSVFYIIFKDTKKMVRLKSVEGVFHIKTGRYELDYDNAKRLCALQAAQLATYSQLHKAWKAGADRYPFSLDFECAGTQQRIINNNPKKGHLKRCGWSKITMQQGNIPVSKFHVQFSFSMCNSLQKGISTLSQYLEKGNEGNDSY